MDYFLLFSLIPRGGVEGETLDKLSFHFFFGTEGGGADWVQGWCWDLDVQCTNQSYEMIFILNNFLNKGISRQNCEVAADSSYSWKVSRVRDEYSG